MLEISKISGAGGWFEWNINTFGEINSYIDEKRKFGN